MSFGGSEGTSSNNSQGSSQSSGFSYYNPANQGAQLANIADIQGKSAGFLPFSGTPLNSATSNPQSTYVAPTLAAANLSPYENQFTSSVIDTSNADLTRQQQQQEQMNHSAATAQGAFGGSGSQVADALTGQNFDLARAQMDAGLRSQGFTQAQAAAAGDIANNLASQGVNLEGQQLAAGNQAQNYNAAFGQYTNAQQQPLLWQALLNNAYGLLGNSPLSVSQGTSQNTASGSSQQAGFNLGFK